MAMSEEVINRNSLGLVNIAAMLKTELTSVTWQGLIRNISRGSAAEKSSRVIQLLSKLMLVTAVSWLIHKRS